jgi:hypothetical protein
LFVLGSRRCSCKFKSRWIGITLIEKSSRWQLKIDECNELKAKLEEQLAEEQKRYDVAVQGLRAETQEFQVSISRICISAEKFSGKLNFLDGVWGQYLYFSFFNTQTIHNKPIVHNSIAMISLKTSYSGEI